MDFRCLSCGKPLQLDYQNCPGCGDAITDFLREYWNKPLGGDYRLIAKLGRGGMGEVYKAHHIHLDNDCVIKVMRPNLTSDPGLGERFLREARVARKIQHRNVATLYQFSGLPDGSYYMVWEYIDGKDLGKIIRERGALPPHEVISISIQALEGLEAIHRAGFVHRDISPDNIMITRDERGDAVVKIIDLGIAKQGTESGETMTATGMFVGKLKYASPEHIGFLPAGERIDGRADLYSFAIVMYEMLAGKAPFIASTPHEYMMKQAKDPPPPIPPERMADHLAPELQTVIFKALEKDRSDRYPSAETFAGALSLLKQASKGDSAHDATLNLRAAAIDAPTIHLAAPITGRPDAPAGSTPGSEASSGREVPLRHDRAPASEPAEIPAHRPAQPLATTEPSSVPQYNRRVAAMAVLAIVVVAVALAALFINFGPGRRESAIMPASVVSAAAPAAATMTAASGVASPTGDAMVATTASTPLTDTVSQAPAGGEGQPRTPALLMQPRNDLAAGRQDAAKSKVSEAQTLGSGTPESRRTQIGIDEQKSAKDIELAFWGSVERGGTAELYDEYLRKYPKGEFSPLAEARGRELRQKPAAQAEEERQRAGDRLELPLTTRLDRTGRPAIVFIRNGDVWIMDIDGSNKRALTGGGGASTPRLANGVVTFQKDQQIYRTDTNGARAAAIPNTLGVLEHDLRPSGDRVVLTYRANLNRDLVTMNIDGSQQRSVNRGSLHQSVMQWGRDGYIYFDQSAIGNAFSQRIYRITEDGSSPPKLLVNYFSQYPAEGGNPPGRVAFLWNQPAPMIRVMDSDGTDQEDLPNTPSGVRGRIGFDYDVNRLYYSTGSDIRSIDMDGSNDKLLASGTTGELDYGN